MSNSQIHDVVALHKTKIIFFAALAVLIAQRFFHFGNIIEEPMAWRQFDTEFFAYDFYKNGINLFKPAVSWMGAHKITILEFPLISAIIAVFYKLFEPAVFYSRLVIFVFYLGSALYLYKLILYLYYRSLACITLLVYLLLPLGIYYSRAVNIDFPVMFFLLSSLYYYLLGIDKEKYSLLILAVILSIFGFLIKAPYMLIIYVPIIYHIYKNNKIRIALRSLLLLIVPGIVFYFWQQYVISANASAPDWYFIPDFFKFTNMSSWYFGGLDQRFDIKNWERLLTRFGTNGITFIGLPLFFAGFFVRLKDGFNKLFFVFYSFGALLYLLIFFTLNVVHDYYQVPLLVVTSFFIAAAVDNILRRLQNRSETMSLAVTSYVMFALMVNGIWFSERWYYRPDKVRNSAAEFIKNNTGENDLVIASIDLTDPRDPRILAPAHRYGWAIRIADLNSELIEKLHKEGADYLSITGNINNDTLNSYLAPYPKTDIILPDGKTGTKLFKLNIP